MSKKRKRRPLSAFSVICFTCGLILVVGNLFMVHKGFNQTVVGSNPLPLQSGARGVDTNPNPLEDTIDLPLNLLLDDNAVYKSMKLVDPKLRKLMQDRLELHRRPTYNRNSLISMSTQDLRKSLSLSSNCVKFHPNISDSEFIASGWTKAVYKSKNNGQQVAVKTVDTNGHDMMNCFKTTPLNPQQCYARCSQKILKEILLLSGLSHPNIIKPLGHCVPERPFTGSDSSTIVSMTTELGESVDIIRLLQMSWEERLRVSYGLTKLLVYLAHSPYGSLALNDFRRQQFVLIDGDLKLSDMDDVGFLEPRCNSSSQCQQYFSSSNFTLSAKCINGLCEGLNEKMNIFNAARHFTTFLLPHGAPSSLRPYVDRVVDAFTNVTTSSNRILSMMERIVDMYSSGVYLNRHSDKITKEYKCYEDKDLAGLFDYRCRYSVASVGCTVSVFDIAEAEELCDNDEQCKAFVVSPQTTWTGRMIIHLKNNVSTPTKNPQRTLCLKPSTLIF